MVSVTLDEALGGQVQGDETVFILWRARLRVGVYRWR